MTTSASLMDTRQACGSFAHPGEKHGGKATIRGLEMLRAKKSKIRPKLEQSQKHEIDADSKCIFPFFKNKAALIS